MTDHQEHDKASPTQDDIFFLEMERRLAKLKPGTASYQTRMYRTLRRFLLPLGLWAIKPRGFPFKDDKEKELPAPHKEEEDT